MNYYETKQLQDREARVIGSGVAFLLAGPVSAFCGAAVFALGLGLPFTGCFYTIWIVMSVIGVIAIAGGIKEKIDRKKNINN